MKKKIFNLQTFAKYSHYIILFLICAVMTVVSDNFLSFSNIISVLRQSSFLVVMSLGMMFAMILGRGNDMSIGAVVAITSCLGAQFLRMSCSPATIVLGHCPGQRHCLGCSQRQSDCLPEPARAAGHLWYEQRPAGRGV